MKKICSAIWLTAAVLLLTGCTAENTSPIPLSTHTSVPTEFTEPPTEAVSLEASGTLPVISITSAENPNSTDFVSLPVASHVAESIASWTPGYKIPPAPYYENVTVSLTDTNGSELVSAEAQVKVRGNWTTTYDKKPLRIKFTEKQNLLDMNDGAEMKNWLLLAEYKDASLLRNKTAFAIAEELFDNELYVSDGEFVEVMVNGQYWGLYLLAEQQQINPDRIDITECPADYTGTDIGYFLEYDGYYTEEDDMQSFFVNYADNAPLLPFTGDEVSEETIRPLNEGAHDPKQNTGITIKSKVYSEEQRDFIAEYVNNVYRIMYYAAYEDKAYVFNEDYRKITETADVTPQQAVEAVADVNSLACSYILNEIACDADIYWSSFFMDVDFGENGDRKLRFEAPWDYDSAFGNKNRCSNGEGFYAASIVPDVNNQYKAVNPWLTVLIQEEWFQEIIREKWTETYDSGAFQRVNEMITEDAKLYEKAFIQNEKRWDSLLNNSAADEWSRAVRRCRTHGEAAAYLVEWLNLRVDFLNEYWHK